MSAAPPPVIEVRDVTTRFGANLVHDHVSLRVEPREVFGIAGGSGSGKTVLLREILMLQRPTSGSVWLLGEDVTHIEEAAGRALRSRCGVLFQQGALFSGLSVAENVAVPLREHTRMQRAFAREVAALKIALVGLPPEAAAKRPDELSGGMRKRAALARAIVLDPEILFLDEPSAGLDPVSAAGIDELIVRLRRLLGLTIVMVTHDLDSLWRVTDRVAVLGAGRIRGIGRMDELAGAADPLIREYFSGPRGRAARGRSWNRE
ncbi:MAG TPA: ATP-binding cassette domain-containing protein [Polyangia bacterium]|jgi:phospholipid/cholesterol/gamma-HCH transport system ATP-binding protein